MDDPAVDRDRPGESRAPWLVSLVVCRKVVRRGLSRTYTGVSSFLEIPRHHPRGKPIQVVVAFAFTGLGAGDRYEARIDVVVSGDVASVLPIGEHVVPPNQPVVYGEGNVQIPTDAERLAWFVLIVNGHALGSTPLLIVDDDASPVPAPKFDA